MMVSAPSTETGRLATGTPEMPASRTRRKLSRAIRKRVAADRLCRYQAKASRRASVAESETGASAVGGPSTRRMSDARACMSCEACWYSVQRNQASSPQSAAHGGRPAIRALGIQSKSELGATLRLREMQQNYPCCPLGEHKKHYPAHPLSCRAAQPASPPLAPPRAMESYWQLGESPPQHHRPLSCKSSECALNLQARIVSFAASSVLDRVLGRSPPH